MLGIHHHNHLHGPAGKLDTLEKIFHYWRFLDGAKTLYQILYKGYNNLLGYYKMTSLKGHSDSYGLARLSNKIHSNLKTLQTTRCILSTESLESSS